MARRALTLNGRVVDARRGRGVDDVAVSNGEFITRSDRSGHFTLRTDPQRHPFVFVTVPAGWQAVGHFYRTTMDCADRECRFEIRRIREPQNTCRFAFLTDLHFGATWAGMTSGRRMESDLRRVCEELPDSRFLLITGDLTQHGRRDDLSRLAEMFDRSPRPIVRVFGGHDGREEAKELQTPLPWARHYHEILGPTWYSFESGPCHFTVYANEDQHFSPSLVAAKRRWLEADLQLARERGLAPIVAMHAPPTPQLARTLAGLGVRLLLYGHWHTLKHWRVGPMQLLCSPPLPFGGIDMMPRGFFDVRIKAAGDVEFDYRPAAQSLCRSSPSRVRDLPLIWSKPLSGSIHRGGIVGHQGRLFVATNDDLHGGQARLHSLDAGSGEIQWTKRFEGAIKHPPVSTGRDRLFLNTQDGILFRLDPMNGRVMWRRRLQNHPHRWLHASPVIVGGDVVVAGTWRGGLEGFDATTGSRRWRIPPQEAKASNSGDAWPWHASAVPVDDDLILPMHGRGVARVSSSTGRMRWTRDLPYFYYLPQPLRWRDGFWCPAATADGFHRLLDARTGRILQEHSTDGVPIAWSLDRDALFLTVDGAKHASLQCRAPASWELRWTADLPADPTGSFHYSRRGAGAQAAPVADDRSVFQSCTDGRLRVFDRNTGRPTAAHNFRSPLFAPPILAHDRLWICTWNGGVHCIHR